MILIALCYSYEAFTQDRHLFDIKYDDATGKVSLIVDELDAEFLYINSLSNGVGSNDLGLDRGKLGNTRIVKFVKYGNKLLLQEPNIKYRAVSDNADERRAVEQAFASSVLWAFDIVKAETKKYTIDLTPFLLQDANDISRLLKDRKEGTYKLEKSRAVVVPNGLLSFPKNTEFESLLTFTGEPQGKHLRTVVPSAEAVTIVQHQSFVSLPDSAYTPRAYHPYSGFNNVLYYDYAQPIEQPIAQRLITRHRLVKKDPSAEMSQAIEPIVYYVDPGCPEPIKTALIDGASWWDQAFAEAGFKDAFQVRELPADAHPLDVRYNVIQWVHRSTRGWSYGASVVDPRTGEIIKGHVSLGSLRVRQDYMIAEGIASPYDGNSDETAMTEMALARLRQLSAHEVGHTIGLAHNFAASANNRASVMDYPHPFVTFSGKKIDFSDAYDDQIGAWDKRAILYGYSEVATESSDILHDILKDTKRMGLMYMSDADARSPGSAHPFAHLWDNGNDPITELKRLMILRAYSLSIFGPNSVADGIPYSELEKILVPVYLMHRYQVEAVAKAIGGVEYTYAVKGFEEPASKVVSTTAQYAAAQELLNTISHPNLLIPAEVRSVMIPAAKGYGRSRESFDSDMNMVFDPLKPAEAYCNFVLSLMLNRERLARMLTQEEVGISEYLELMSTRIFDISAPSEAYARQLYLLPQKVYLIHLIRLATDESINQQVSAYALAQLSIITQSYLNSTAKDIDVVAHRKYLTRLINNMNSPTMAKLPSLTDLPPGSPIGCDH